MPAVEAAAQKAAAQAQRERTLKRFRDGRFSVLVATDVLYTRETAAALVKTEARR